MTATVRLLLPALPGEQYARDVKGILTTDHATSSHGLPVLLIDGQPYGPGDLPDTAEMWFSGDTPITVADQMAAYDAARRAGYDIEDPWPWRDGTEPQDPTIG